MKNGRTPAGKAPDKKHREGANDADPHKVENLAKAGRKDFDPNEGSD